jgi:hypothetical protein
MLFYDLNECSAKLSNAGELLSPIPIPIICQGYIWPENAHLTIGFMARSNGAGIAPGYTLLVARAIITAVMMERMSAIA